MIYELDALGEAGEGRTLLRSPRVGEFVPAVAPGAPVASGQVFGRLLVLGRVLELRVPAEVPGGVVVGPAPAARRTPVDRGAILLELDPSALGRAAAAAADRDPGGEEERGLAVVAPQSGRFYDRPSPEAPPFVKTGDRLRAGTTIGLIEVMKTFNQVTYGGPGLPAEARALAFEVPPEAEVERGQVLLRVEDAGRA